MLKLNLTNPIAFFDIESTGKDVNTARIVTIAGTIYYPGGLVSNFCFKINPGVPIPAEASAVHGITDDMVKLWPKLEQEAKAICLLLSQCDFAGFNSNKYDIPLLVNELSRVGFKLNVSKKNFIDVLALHRALNPNTLTALYEKYTGAPMQNAHDAEADINATIEVFNAIMDKHVDELPQDAESLSLFCNNGQKRLDTAGKFAYSPAGNIMFNFGKHNQKEVDIKDFAHRDYLMWILGGNFDGDTKDICNQLLNQPV